ncbi:uncharacterized protein EDB91DRAFT_346317 [Suillus paluster]|uniref:uncharacterized protein n=1 Tax=Suillus paluster TaxID=48578 RepID=UPI001B86AEFC|nr:uncharacterized protein EDB91DRAFT_346317 [Suillus paluster]KAG1720278.1 hypothetical protein EDB91DRAFT_346317 [Suillus paluster]
MRSFTTFTILLLTAVLSTFTNATPITRHPGAAVPADFSSVKSDVAGLNKELDLPRVGREITANSSDETLAAVFTTFFTQIQPLTDQLTYITPENATVADISPVVAQIKIQLTSLISQIQPLADQGGLGDLGGLLDSLRSLLSTITSLLQSLPPVVTGLLEGLGEGLQRSLGGSVLVGNISGDLRDVIFTVADVGHDATSILKIINTLVPGTVSSLRPLLAPFANTIASSGLTDHLSLLGLSN